MLESVSPSECAPDAYALRWMRTPC